MKINTDQNKIEELLSRGINAIYPSKKDLQTKLLSGKRLKIYIGIDPTANYIHIGHTTNYFTLKRFWELGHEVVVLVGDTTAQIGDPSDKNSVRKQLTKKEVKENLSTFKKQIGKMLPFDNKKNPISFQFNSKWLEKLTLEEIVTLTSKITVQKMIERDIFQKRLSDNKPLYIHEFLYPLLQGYDSVALSCDVEIGGTDQTFNMLIGRSLLKQYQQREKFVMTTILLENPNTGEKLMSKAHGTGIPINMEPNEMFGKVMSLPDEIIIQCFRDCTDISLDEVTKIEKGISKGENPMNSKIYLAYKLVEIYHGNEDADKAKKSFIDTFSKKLTPDKFKTVSGKDREQLSDILAREKILSKTKYKTHIENGAISQLTGDKWNKLSGIDSKVKEGEKFKIGKKIFIEIKIKK